MIRAPLSIARAQLLVVVHFDERGQTQLPGSLLQPHEIRLLECRHDQQRRIGAVGPRLEELILVDDEVFAEERERDRLAHSGEMFEGAIEERRLGEHRDRGRTTGFVPGEQWQQARTRAASTPRDGERLLHSAITFDRPGFDRAARNSSPRGVRPAARRSRAARLSFWRRTSVIVSVAATMAASRSGVAVMPRPPRETTAPSGRVCLSPLPSRLRPPPVRFLHGSTRRVRRRATRRRH